MPVYQYTVRDRNGEPSRGAIEAKDPAELRRILRSNNLYLVNFQARHKSGSSPFGLRPPKAQELVVTFRQLATLARAGLPVVRALQLVEEQVSSPLLRRALVDIRETVTDGGTISAGMRRHPKLFSRLTTSFIEAGEAIGSLESAFELSAEQVDRDDQLRRQVKQALMYPKFVVTACLLATFAMLTFVVPSFREVYNSVSAELPGPTRLLLFLNECIMGYWWAILAVGLALYFGFKRAIQIETVQRQVDRLLLNLPVAGPIVRKVAIGRFVQTCSSALGGGVPLLKVLSIASATGGNSVITDAVAQASQGVREGATLSAELARTGEFPAMVTQMIAAGEASGNLEDMLNEVSLFYRRDIDHALTSLTKLIEPMVTVVVGGLVLLVLIALYMPVFNLSNVFQQAK